VFIWYLLCCARSINTKFYSKRDFVASCFVSFMCKSGVLKFLVQSQSRVTTPTEKYNIELVQVFNLEKVQREAVELILELRQNILPQPCFEEEQRSRETKVCFVQSGWRQVV